MCIIYEITSMAADDVKSPTHSSTECDVNVELALWESADNLIAVWFSIATWNWNWNVKWFEDSSWPKKIFTIATLRFTLSPYTIAIAIDPNIARIYRAGTRPANNQKMVTIRTLIHKFSPTSSFGSSVQTGTHSQIHNAICEWTTYCLFIRALFGTHSKSIFFKM